MFQTMFIETVTRLKNIKPVLTVSVITIGGTVMLDSLSISFVAQLLKGTVVCWTAKGSVLPKGRGRGSKA